MLGILVRLRIGFICCRKWGEVIIYLIFMRSVILIVSWDIDKVVSNLIVEVDRVSWCLLIISVWVVLIRIKASRRVNINNKYKRKFLLLKILLLIRLVFRFRFSDFILFFIRFECCLIPILLLILGWGYQPERAQAGIYILFYTLFGSFPLLFLLLNWKWGLGSVYIGFKREGVASVAINIFLVGAFLIKFPLYGVHLWLLKAHVEAPVAGSIVLAGVLLKLGGYGLIRSLGVFSGLCGWVLESLVCISIWGGAVVRIGCLRQMDIKLLIARSSVVHIRICVSGLMVIRGWGYKGCLVAIVAHGLCSSGLFYIARLVYDCRHSRSICISKGLLNLMPRVRLWWFLLVRTNIAAPPRINLLGEVLLLSSIVRWRNRIWLGLGVLSFFGAGYRVYLFSLSQHGSTGRGIRGFKRCRVLGFIVIFLHWSPLNLLILMRFSLNY